MFFYLLFPVIIVWVRKNPWRHIAAALIVVAVAEALYIFVGAPLAPPGQRGFLVSQFPIAHLLEFLVGVASGKLLLGGGREWIAAGNRRSLLIAGSLAGITAISYFQPVHPVFFAMTPLFAVLVVALAVRPRSGRSCLAAPWMLLLGEASFSLYLIHVPLINVYKMLGLPSALGWILLLVVVGLSILVFKAFESPARRLVRAVLAGWVERGQAERMTLNCQTTRRK
jgi:peptidoglycan/LPS O-acetylase OafA/YrhL